MVAKWRSRTTTTDAPMGPRVNRRFYPFNSFRPLLGIGAPTYERLYSGEWHILSAPVTVQR